MGGRLQKPGFEIRGVALYKIRGNLKIDFVQFCKFYYAETQTNQNNQLINDNNCNIDLLRNFAKISPIEY